MTDNQPSDTSDNASDMTATVASYSKSLQMSEPAAIPPEHRRYADTILAMDPVEDIRGNVSTDSIAPNFKPKLTTLSPELQAKARALMEKGALDESEAVTTVVKQHLAKSRAAIGSSPNTNEFHRELISIASEVRDIERKRAGLVEMIDRVVDVRLAKDENGEPIAEPIYGYSEGSRRKMQGEVEWLDQHKKLLVNPDGTLGLERKKRADRALATASAQFAEAVDKQKLRKEAEKRADEILREEEMERMAKQIANTKRRRI